MPARRIAFLDVDQTLLYNQEDMNDILIGALIEKGINEVYLFTNMSLSDIKCYGRETAPYSRSQVIHHLESKGLSVKGVITPADPYFPQKLDSPPQIGAAYKTLYEPQMAKRLLQKTPLNLQDYASEDTLEFLFADLLWSVASYMLAETIKLKAGETKDIPTLCMCLINCTTGKPDEPARYVSLDEAKVFFSEERNRLDYALEKYLNPSAIISISGQKSTDPKGVMMAHLLQTQGLIPSDTSIYYFDDRADHIKAVETVLAAFKAEQPERCLSFYSCLVPQSFVKAIHDKQKEAYLACLNNTTIFALPNLTPLKNKPGQENVSASFLLSVLAHPATKSIAAGLIFAGILGLAFGGFGLVGIEVGVALLSSPLATAVGASTLVVGGGLGAASFFASTKIKQIEQVSIGIELTPLPIEV